MVTWFGQDTVAPTTTTIFLHKHHYGLLNQCECVYKRLANHEDCQQVVKKRRSKYKHKIKLFVNNCEHAGNDGHSLDFIWLFYDGFITFRSSEESDLVIF